MRIFAFSLLAVAIGCGTVEDNAVSDQTPPSAATGLCCLSTPRMSAVSSARSCSGCASAASGSGGPEAVKGDWEQAPSSLSNRMDALEKKLAKLQRSLDGGSARRVQTELKVVTATAREEPSPRRWLHSTRAYGRYHREASRRKGAPSWAWSICCGWRFGLSEHYEWVTEAEATNASLSWCDKGCDMV